MLMEKIYSVIRYLTYPAVFVRKMLEFLLCTALRIDPPADLEEIPYDEIKGHTPHGEFLFPAKAIVFNLSVFLFQLAGAVGFLAGAIISLCFLDVGLINPTTGSFDPVFLLYILFMYLGICFAANLFPSADSVENFWALCIAEAGTFSRIIFVIPGTILRVGVLLENLGITAVLAVILPIILKIVL